MQAYLISVKKLFAYYKKLGDDAMAQVADEKLFFQTNEDSNSIAIIVQHLAGNMLSRWTDFLTTDGEKEWRNRDAEFEVTINTREELISFWNRGWKCLLDALEPLTESDLDKIVYIRNEGHTVLEAINRQLAHYPYHVGQIVFLAKMLNDNEWKSLSIPKNKSKEYNQQKFSQEKNNSFFTDNV
ncbi:MAG TPA: DUF1572 domain-containing protein [Chitinophagales bacterium]|nr:DUF1572 domain-containing protein [Chitinophagales bacterium]